MLGGSEFRLRNSPPPLAAPNLRRTRAAGQKAGFVLLRCLYLFYQHRTARRKRHIACGEFFPFRTKLIARSFCCSSLPNRNRFVGLAVGVPPCGRLFGLYQGLHFFLNTGQNERAFSKGRHCRLEIGRFFIPAETDIIHFLKDILPVCRRRFCFVFPGPRHAVFCLLGAEMRKRAGNTLWCAGLRRKKITCLGGCNERSFAAGEKIRGQCCRRRRAAPSSRACHARRCPQWPLGIRDPLPVF